MSTFDEMIRLVTCRYNDVIMKYCAGVFDYLGLNNFWYFRHNANGASSFFGTNIPFNEYFSDKKLYLNFPFCRHPKFFNTGIKLFAAVPDFSPGFKKVEDLFNFKNEILFIKRSSVEVEGYGFSSISSSKYQLETLVNNLSLLRRFFAKFKEDNKCIFSKMEDNQIDLGSIVGEYFSKEDESNLFRKNGNKILYNQIGLSEMPVLSSREITILTLIVRGFSAGKIAPQMSLSRRTVEHHIERIKDKLGCSARTELVQKGRELEFLGCLG